MTDTAENVRRINVWRTTAIAAEAAAADGVGRAGRMTIYPAQSIAEANLQLDEGGGSEPFVGVLDLVNFSGALFAFGHRAMSTAMLGQPVYRLIRDSDAAELDILSDAVTGEIDAAAVTAWAGGVCRLHTWYDQTGAESHLTDSGGDGFVKIPWVAAGPNGKPAFIQGSGLGSRPNTYTAGTAFNCNFPDSGGYGTAFMLARGPILLDARNANATGQFQVRGGSMAKIETTSDGGNNTGAGGEYNELIPNTDWVLIDASVDFGDNDFYYNGTLFPENRTDDVTALAANHLLQPQINFSNSTTFYGIQEVFVCPGVIDADQRLAARQNMATWAGITLP